MTIHCMVDIETMGQRFDAPVLSVGAVFFDPDSGRLKDEFYRAVDIDSAFRFGRTSGSTVKWWMQQGDAARQAAIKGTESLPKVLQDLTAFYKQNPKAPVWGNGPSFDCTILEHAYARCEIPAPWAFWNIRDCRTIKELGEAIGYTVPKLAGTAHNALDDAKHQAMWVSEIRKRLLNKITAATGGALDNVPREYDDI